MANAPPRACRCGARVAAGERCPQCDAKRKRDTDEHRGTAVERGYGSAWRKATQAWRAEDPERNLCVDCLSKGVVRYGRHTDHIVPHKGNETLFWRRENWQALCDRHHSSKTAREDGGFGNPSNRHAMPEG